MIFLPVLRIGGMQFFRAEGLKPLAKCCRVPPTSHGDWWLAMSSCQSRASWLSAWSGCPDLMRPSLARPAMASGGFTPSDLSFDKYPPAAESVGTFFMILSALPFIHYVQMMNGHARPLLRDPQVRAFLLWLGLTVILVTMWRLNTSSSDFQQAFRETLFNITSVMTGTGFQSSHFATWEGFAMVAAFVIGMIGGCS